MAKPVQATPELWQYVTACYLWRKKRAGYVRQSVIRKILAAGKKACLRTRQ